MRDACLVLKIGGCHEVEWRGAVQNPGFSRILRYAAARGTKRCLGGRGVFGLVVSVLFEDSIR